MNLAGWHHIVEVGLALEAGLAPSAVLHPAFPIRQQVICLALPRDFDQSAQGHAGVGNDAEVGGKHPTNLGRFDISMDELAPLRVGL